MPDTTDKVKMSYLLWLASGDETRQKNYRAFREYYDGDHDTQLTDRQRNYLQIKMGREFNVNYCPIVVDALAERLIVSGFDAGDSTEAISDILKAIRIDALQGVVHLSAIRDGDTYLIVGWDNDKGLPTFTHQLAYDGTEGIKLHYDNAERGKVEFASKRWRIEQGGDAGYINRMNLYYPDRIEKYISDSRDEFGYQPYQPPTDTGWPVWWTDTGTEGGQPLGVPVIHFKNNEQGYNYGTSELADITPVQNALNKSIIDLLAAADTTAFRIYTMIGDNPTGISIAPGMWVYSERPPSGDEGAAIGHIPGEDLSPLIDLKDSFVAEIARISRTPLSYFQMSGQQAAEGTLKQQESGLLSKVYNRQIYFGNSWEDAMRMAIRLENVFGGGTIPEDTPLETIWKDPVSRNDSWEFKAGIIPKLSMWREMGYSDDQIDQMIEDYRRGENEMINGDFTVPGGQ